MLWNAFSQGAFGYLDISEIFILALAPFNASLLLYLIKYNEFKSKLNAAFTILSLNIIGTLFSMIGYASFIENTRILTFNNHVPFSINIGFGALMWLCTLIVISLIVPNPTLKLIFKVKEEEKAKKDSVKETLESPKPEEIKTAALPVSPLPTPAAEEVPPSPQKVLETNQVQEIPIPEKPQGGSTESGEVIGIGSIIHGVEFEANTGKDRSGIRTKNRIGGKISFPDRRGPQPLPGEIWTVQITNTNPNESVYFVKCLKRESALEEQHSQDVRNSVADNPKNDRSYDQGVSQ